MKTEYTAMANTTDITFMLSLLMMNNSAAHARNEPKRPAWIAELSEMAMLELWDGAKGFKHYLRAADKYGKAGIRSHGFFRSIPFL